MGGPGRGRWPANYTRRRIAECCTDLSITEMTRTGALVHQIETSGMLVRTDRETQQVHLTIEFKVIWHSADVAWLRLAYELPHTTETVRYWIQVACTRPSSRGTHLWFVCPLVGSAGPCGRHAGKLYLPPRYKYFGCRLCYKLSYASVHDYEERAGVRRLGRSRGKT